MSDGTSLNASVTAFLAMNETLPNASMTYKANAAFDFKNGTVVRHYVHSSNREDYLGKTLVRDVKYNSKTGLLLLSPREKMLGVSFSLLWKPYNSP